MIDDYFGSKLQAPRLFDKTIENPSLKKEPLI